MAGTSNKWSTRYYLFSAFFVAVTPPGILLVTLLFPGEQDKKFGMETKFTSLTLSGNAGRFLSAASPFCGIHKPLGWVEIALLCRFDEIGLLGGEPLMPTTGVGAWGTGTWVSLNCVISLSIWQLHLYRATAVLIRNFHLLVEWKFLNKDMSCLCRWLCLFGVFHHGVGGWRE